jgi:hypothetical protein
MARISEHEPDQDGRRARARAIFERCLDAGHPEIALCRENLAGLDTTPARR